MTEIRLIVPGIPSTLNAWSRSHWGVRDAERKEWAQKMAVACLSRKLSKRRPVFSVPVRLDFHYFVKSKRKKNDLLNRVPKHLEDGLKGFVFIDDSQVVESFQKMTRGADRDETHIRVTPASEECCE